MPSAASTVRCEAGVPDLLRRSHVALILLVVAAIALAVGCALGDARPAVPGTASFVSSIAAVATSTAAHRDGGREGVGVGATDIDAPGASGLPRAVARPSQPRTAAIAIYPERPETTLRLVAGGSPLRAPRTA